MRYLIAADTGGTFTDLAVYDLETGDTSYGKALTDYDDLVAGVLSGLADSKADVAGARLLKHGTTHVINSLIERRGARVAIVTTRGFRDVLEMGRGNRSVPFDLTFARNPPLVPRRLRFEVTERISGQGEVLKPLDTDELEALMARLRDLEVESVAVSFLNAYRNPAHEEQAAAILRAGMPSVFVTTGAELSREWMEYERTSTVAANAYVGPQIAGYIANFEERLKRLDFTGRLYMMGSNGGVMSGRQATVLPIAMVESGPVGGCIGAAEYARALGIPKAIAFDMGGTTAKCALVEGGQFEVESTYHVGGYERGFPIRTPVLDIVEVGAGGGSIAWIDENGRLKLGPKSAGSTPGPIAFRRGGTEPTVTDANVVLGRIGSDAFLNGRLELDVVGALDAIDRTLADPLGYKGPGRADHVAQGILDLANVAMSGAIKQISTERGRDIRQYDLIAFGGGGPLFAAELARALMIPKVIIPPNPGAFSSFGMLMAQARRDIARTFLQVLSDETLEAADRAFAEMEKDLSAEMVAEFDAGQPEFEREAEMRYPSQSHSVRVRIPHGGRRADVVSAFERVYKQRYGHINAGLDPEMIILRVAGFVDTPRPKLGSDVRGQAGNPEAFTRRTVYFPIAGKRIHTPVYRRAALPVGFRAVGPAIIEEYSSTTIVGIGDHVEVGHLGELRITFDTIAGKVHR
jgi:N-methylhydantoinase A